MSYPSLPAAWIGRRRCGRSCGPPSLLGGFFFCSPDRERLGEHLDVCIPQQLGTGVTWVLEDFDFTSLDQLPERDQADADMLGGLRHRHVALWWLVHRLWHGSPPST